MCKATDIIRLQNMFITNVKTFIEPCSSEEINNEVKVEKVLQVRETIEAQEHHFFKIVYNLDLQ